MDDVDTDRDRALVARFQAGDRTAFEELYRLYRARVQRRVARSVQVADAEDVVQEAFLAVWRRLGVLPDGEHVFAYLTVTARHLVLAHHRAPASQPLDVDPAAPAYDGHDVDLTALPADQRAVVEARVLDGLSRQATARLLGLSVDRVDLLLGRALASLRARTAR